MTVFIRVDQFRYFKDLDGVDEKLYFMGVHKDPFGGIMLFLLSILACIPDKDNPSDSGSDDTGFSSEEQEAYRVTKTITFNDVEVDVIIDKPIGNTFDVLLAYHGTVWSDNLIHSAAETTLDKFAQIITQDDMMIVSVVYPEENLLLGDNIVYAEAALLWTQQLAAEELDIGIERIFLGGHSQGGYLVTRLNTMHTTDGVIANCPGPLDMRYRCQLEEEGNMQQSNQCQQLLSTYGSTADNPDPYDAISLLNFTSGYRAPYFLVQGMEDAAIQLHSWPTFKEAINNCSDCASIQIVEAPEVGHPGLFESEMAAEAFRAFIE